MPHWNTATPNCCKLLYLFLLALSLLMLVVPSINMHAQDQFDIRQLKKGDFLEGKIHGTWQIVQFNKALSDRIASIKYVNLDWSRSQTKLIPKTELRHLTGKATKTPKELFDVFDVKIEKLSVGDPVEAFAYGGWQSGEVLEISGKQVQVRFELHGNTTTHSVLGNDLRWPVDQFLRKTFRTWTSLDGNFTLNASLAGEEADKIRLLDEQGNTIELAINQLSLADQDFLAAFKSFGLKTKRPTAPPSRRTMKLSDLEIGDQIEVEFEKSWLLAEVLEFAADGIVAKFVHPDTSRYVQTRFYIGDIRAVTGTLQSIADDKIQPPLFNDFKPGDKLEAKVGDKWRVVTFKYQKSSTSIAASYIDPLTLRRRTDIVLDLNIRGLSGTLPDIPEEFLNTLETSDLKPGDSVLLIRSGNLYPGNVVQSNRMTAVVVYQKDGKQLRATCNSHSLRPKFDPQRLRQSRLWVSADGQFKVSARFQRPAPDAVDLLRDDGDPITVPLEKLSQQDLNFLRAFHELSPNKELLGSLFPDAPSHQSSETAAFTSEVAASTSLSSLPFPLTAPNISKSVSLNSLKNQWTIPQFQPDSNANRNWQAQLKSLPEEVKILGLRIDAESKRLAIAIGSRDSKLLEILNPTILILDSSTGNEIGRHELPADVAFADISPNASRLLTVSKEDDVGRVDVWQLTPKTLEHEIGWVLPENGTTLASFEACKFIGNNHLATIDKKLHFSVWQIDELNLVAQAKLPGSCRKLAPTPDDQGVVFACNQTLFHYDLTSSKYSALGKARLLPSSNNSSAAVSQGGKVAIVGNRGSVTIWGPDTPEPYEFSIPTGKWSFVDSHAEWLDEQYLVCSNGNIAVVVDTLNRVNLVSYLLDSSEVFYSASRLWIVDKATKKIGHVKLQPAKFANRLKASREDLLMFGKGQTVSIEADMLIPFADSQKVIQHYKNQLNAMGAKVVTSGGNITIRLLTEKGPTQTVRGLEHHFKTRNDEMTKATPHIMRVEFIKNERVLFKKIFATKIPKSDHFSPLILKNESLQSFLDRTLAPDPKFFFVNVPDNMAEHPSGGTYALIKLDMNGTETDAKSN